LFDWNAKLFPDGIAASQRHPVCRAVFMTVSVVIIARATSSKR
jgi:hypothetical protein